MSDSGIQAAAGLICMGLMLNGCFSALGQGAPNLNEYNIIDESVIADGIMGVACLSSGRKWEYGKCKE